MVTEVSRLARTAMVVEAVSRTAVCEDLSRTALLVERVSSTSSVFIKDTGIDLQGSRLGLELIMDRWSICSGRGRFCCPKCWVCCLL